MLLPCPYTKMSDKKKLLLIDDDLLSIETLKFAMEAKGYEVITAANGKDALSIVREKRPLLILVDVMMPKMDGYHFCRLIKFDTRFKHIPIIVVSARRQEADVKLGFACGCDDYVTKPYDINNLISLIENYLNNLNIS